MAALGSIQRHVLGLRHLQVIHKCCIQTAVPLCFQTTNSNCKVKTTITHAVYQKRKRRLEKALRFIDKKGEDILKPIEEKELSLELKKEIRAGTRLREKRAYTAEELESQVLLEKEWARYKMKQLRHECKVYNKLSKLQEKALDKLREDSEELYQLAIKKDDSFLPYVFKGPVYTPPIPGYNAEDGNYVDKTNYFTETIDDLSVLDPLTGKKR